MIWTVHTSDVAEQNLQGIERYIADVLLEPITAEKQVDRILTAMESLDQFPLRYRLYEQEPWRSKGFRVFSVDNYLIFYLPDEAAATVAISRIIYGAQDIPAQLEQLETQLEQSE